MDGEQLDYVNKVQIDALNVQIHRSAWCCFRCRTAFFPYADRQEITDMLNAAEKRYFEKQKQKGAIKPASSSMTETLITNFATNRNTLYVCKGIIACKRKGHNFQSATGVLLNKNGGAVKININYCPQCQKCFIGYEEYTYYRNLYGILLGNIKVTNGAFASADMELAEESILHLCGYSVNQNVNLSAPERQNILKYLIDSKVSSKPEIINYLDYFIRRNGRRQNMEEAVCRWKEDLKWVREYQLDRQRHFELINIQNYKGK